MEAFKDHYLCISKNNYVKLKELPKLKIKEIYNSLQHKYNRLLFYCYYGYYREIDKYTNFELNNTVLETWQFPVIIMNKPKVLKYFISRGIKFNYQIHYLYAIKYYSYKLFPYFESFNHNLNFININLNFPDFPELKLKIYKYLYKINPIYILKYHYADYDSTIKTHFYIEDILFDKKLNHKYLKSKGVNIYIKRNGINPCALAKKHCDKSRFNSIKKLYIRWYCADKLCYI